MYNVDCGTSDFILEMFKKTNIEKAIGQTYNEDHFVISKIQAFSVFHYKCIMYNNIQFILAN